jgi:anthranilate phosphoribosyltransferase
VSAPSTDPAAAGLKPYLAKVAAGLSLAVEDAEAAFAVIMSGGATPAQIGGFLMALRVRGETVDEITGAVRVMRAKALPVRAPEDAIDIVGTGGDSSGTFNISTAAALVVAGAGVPVAKHGNRALSSRCGSADVLAALGVNIEADVAAIERAIAEAGFGFLMAPRHHAAMRHVAGPRVELGVRTLFNLLGPLSNPARVRRQFTGVFAADWVEPLARVLGNLGCTRAWVVYGTDGLDELTTTAPSRVAEFARGAVRAFTVAPEDAGLPRARPEDLKGGDAAANAAAMRAILAGWPGPLRDAVLFNAAAALIVAGRCPSLADGLALARQAIDSGRAAAVLEQVIAITNAPPPAA